MMTCEKKHPETIEELVDECRALSSRIDLYDMEGDDGLFADRLCFDPSEPPSGEYVYGCAMVPAQWVLHVLSGKEVRK
ncbi:hypothetical protein [uncultured Slackia sp.]|uniref:hypothetical protein n=1 Tax=uncultured Slackia sp. TaxID=665903 RepID=UPI0025CD7235|nr:hypothetical protein [uncultured Slackia sp.]